MGRRNTQNELTNKKAVLFARVSTARQKKEGLSIDEIQLPRIREYAKKQGLEVVAEFTAGESGGSSKERKKFNAMVEYVEKHKDVQNIVVYRVDRATRNFKDAVRIKDLCDNRGVRLHCVDERLVLDKNTTGSKMTEWNTKVFVGQEYLNRVKDDGFNTKYTKLDRGELPWPAPYGYQHTKDENGNKTVDFKEPQATIAREICRKYSTGAYSCLSLQKEINEKYGTNITRDRVHKILREKFNIGIIVDRKDGGEEYPHFYPRLISRDIFNLNQDILDGRNLNHKHCLSKTDALYTGLVECTMDGCTCSLTFESKSKTQKNGNQHTYRYYHCSGGTAVHGKGKIHNITEERIDEAICNVLTSLKPSEERLKELRRELATVHEEKNKAFDRMHGTLEARQKQIRDFKRRSYDLWMEERITQDVYDENVARYDEELAEIKEKMSKLETADEQYYITVGYLLDLVEHAGDLYKVAKPEEKRQIVSIVFSNLKWDGKNLELPLKKPFDTILNTSNVLYGWGCRIRTCECWSQNPVPYHLANPQSILLYHIF